MSEKTTLMDVLKKTLEIEEKSIEFCFDAAEQSKSLLACDPRAFRIRQEKRGPSNDLAITSGKERLDLGEAEI